MGIVHLICSHCGGQLELPDDRNFAFCMHCGTKCVIKDDPHVTNNYTTINQKIVYGSEMGERKEEKKENYLEKAKLFRKVKDYPNAAAMYGRARDADPGDWHVYTEYAKYITDDFRILWDRESYEPSMEAAKELNGQEMSEEFERIYSEYINKKTAFEDEMNTRWKEITEKCVTVSDDRKYMKRFTGALGMIAKMDGRDFGKEFFVPHGVSYIGGTKKNERNFTNMDRIETIYIPRTVKMIGPDTLSACVNCRNVYLDDRDGRGKQFEQEMAFNPGAKIYRFRSGSNVTVSDPEHARRVRWPQSISGQGQFSNNPFGNGFFGNSTFKVGPSKFTKITNSSESSRSFRSADPETFTKDASDFFGKDISELFGKDAADFIEKINREKKRP